MKPRTVVFVVCLTLSVVTGYKNVTIDRVPLQLREFKNEHPKPLGLLTTSDGAPVDIRDTIGVNSDIFNNYHLDILLHTDSERIPERVVHAKGFSAYGYFVVTHDVSKYTSADVFNGVGKKTPVFGRFSTAVEGKSGNDMARENKGLALKMYTKEGNLDFLCLHVPVFEYRDPIVFSSFIKSVRNNPKTNIIIPTSAWDFLTLRPEALNAVLYKLTDYGIPYGYRKMDIFPIHTYIISNKHGDRTIAKFNFRTEQGLANLTTAEAQAIASQDPNFFIRDLYNAIANKNYPSWRLEMDLMDMENLNKIDYNPFDVNRTWKTGTYKTIVIGRLTFDRNTDNDFRDSEQSAFSPANLVPGIPGPIDFMFKARKLSYRDTHKNRLGINAHKIPVNSPLYAKSYNRDGDPPVQDNMRDAPNYYPNSFSGPEPYVDVSRPWNNLILNDRTSVDLEPVSDLYNKVVRDDAHKQRLADNTAASIVAVDKVVVKRALKLFSLVDPDFGQRVTTSYKKAKRIADDKAKLDVKTRFEPLATCIDLFTQGQLDMRTHQ